MAGAEQAQGSGGKPVKDCGVASVLGLDVTLKWESLWLGGTRSDSLEEDLSRGLLKQGWGLGGCQGELVGGQLQLSQ